MPIISPEPQGEPFLDVIRERDALRAEVETLRALLQQYEQRRGRFAGLLTTTLGYLENALKLPPEVVIVEIRQLPGNYTVELELEGPGLPFVAEGAEVPPVNGTVIPTTGIPDPLCYTWTFTPVDDPQLQAQPNAKSQNN